MELNIDYVSDLHLKFYINDIKDIKVFVKENITPKIKSNILVIAGDICEDINYISEFLYECSKYYDKVLFIAGNHEYYIPNIKFVYMSEMGKEFDYNSMNKIKRIDEIFKENSNIIFLDRASSNHGICEINGYNIAGDTLWYKPKNIIDWTYYYPSQNDRNYILTDDSKHNQIIKLHDSSINWYNSLPDNLDLIISHIPPMEIKNNGRGNNCCYYTNVDKYKSKVWIYGHDHKTNTFTKDETLFTTNPWGYSTDDFMIKTLTLNK